MMNPIRLSANILIHAYRKFLSPRKGYKCAHHKVHNTGSCSDLILVIVKESSILNWKTEIFNQFESCKQASQELKKRKDKPRDRGCDPSDACDLFDL